MLFTRKSLEIPTREDALPGRDTPIVAPGNHLVLGTPIGPPFPEGTERALFGMGCFWGAERMFWQAQDMYTTAVGYSAGSTPNPTYQEVCTGRTGHNEVVLAVFETSGTSYEAMLKIFWEGHDPTQGMRQGNDVGTSYRSIILVDDKEQRAAAEASKAMYQERLSAKGYGAITTEIAPAPPFYYAEDYHQQYLAKNPNGYCPNHATGVKLPDDFAVTPLQYVD